jgi:xanthine dehydrogenase iron-sulfur cluster and FAD-binding subunit A
MVLAGEALLLQNPSPTREEIRKAINGNLCRCTGYKDIVDAIESAAVQRQRGEVEHAPVLLDKWRTAFAASQEGTVPAPEEVTYG